MLFRSFVMGSFNLGVPQAVGFFQAFPDFILDCQCYFQCHWGDAGKQQLAYGIVDCLSGDVLTGETTTIKVLTGTLIVGPQMLAAGGVARVHALPTDTAQKQTLQQGRTFTRCASPAFHRRTRGILSQLSQVGFIMVPRQISGMGVLDEHLPLFWRQTPDCTALSID